MSDLVLLHLFFVLFFLNMLFSLPASLPGMWDRTITIGSAGKTFSVTGWKVRNPTKHERSSRDVIVNKQHLRTVVFFVLFFFLVFKARLVHRTRALGQASSDRHAEHSVHLPDSSAGKCAAPHLLL